MRADTLTLLFQAEPGLTTAKTLGIGTSGSLTVLSNYDAGTWWEPVSVTLSGIRELAGALELASGPDYRVIVIRGEPTASEEAVRRRINDNFSERPRRWVCCDFDRAVVEGADLVGDPQGAVGEVVRRYLPDYFWDVTCFWQLSSSAGLVPGMVKVHVWFWLSRPVGESEGKYWAKRSAPDIDRALFQRVLPHYISAPRFVGVSDHLPRRTGLLVGAREQVDFPFVQVLEDAPAEGYAESTSPTTASGRRRLDKLCDRIRALEVGERPPEIFQICCEAGRLIADGELSPADAERSVASAIGGEPLEDRHARAMQNGLQRGYADQLRPAPPPQSTPSRDALERYARSLARKKSNARACELGEALLGVCRGEVFAAPSEWEAVGEAIFDALIEQFPDCAPEGVAEHFRLSCDRMARAADGAPTVDLVAFELRQRQDAVRARQVEEQRRRRRERNTRMAETGRIEPYTAEELAAFGDMTFQWIVQKGTSYYLFFEGAYVGPFGERDVRGACETWLAPARATIELYRMTKQGDVVAKSAEQLVREYGTVADRVEVDFMAQRSYWDAEPSRRTLVEAPCPLRPVEPRHHPGIARWLELFAGDRHGVLLDWLSVVVDLDRPCRALLVTGPKGAGKTLLALGVARIWTTGAPTALDEVFADFNSKLLDCPLTLADEQMPRAWNGRAKNAELRLHIQARSRPLKRKYLPTVELKGATHTIVAANNEAILATTEILSPDDVDAIAARYLHVPVSRESAEYLKCTDTSDWVSGDRIAEHVLWLVVNHRATTTDARFLVGVEDPTLVHKLANRSGPRSAICQWLVGFLLNPRPLASTSTWAVGGEGLVVVRGGKLLVNAQGILRGWQHYVGNEDCPTVGVLNTALAGLSAGRTKPGKINYRIIDTEAVVIWAEETGFSDRDAISAALSVDTVVDSSRVERLN